MYSSSMSKFVLLFGSCTVLTLFFQMSSLERMVISDGDDETSQSRIRRRKLGDGCYHVFLDVGAKIVIHTRFLYEPHRYPDSMTSVAAFAEKFGSQRDNRDYCVFAFEPNPKFEQRHLGTLPSSRGYQMPMAI